MYKDKDQLNAEFDKKKYNDWYSIYHDWDCIKSKTYTEIIAEILLERFEKIDLDSAGLRQTKSFKTDEHHGQAELSGDIDKATEKRLCRAMFNVGKIDHLGRVVDYETPLKEEKDSCHGDIDLLCLRDDTLLIVEAKQPGSDESLLKAILEAFVYTCLVASAKEKFLNDFGLSSDLKLCPAILTFEGATSGQQLDQSEEYRQLGRLCKYLNEELAKKLIEPFEFYVLPGNKADWVDSLTTKPSGETNPLVVFKRDISLTPKRITFP